MLNTLSSQEANKLRKNAGEAYKKHAQYYQPRLPSLADLEDLLLGNKDKEAESDDRKDAIKEFQQTEGKEKRTPYLSIQAIKGYSNEETIDLLKKTRNEALSQKPVTVKDFQLAATASSRIQHERSQIVLNKIAATQIKQEWKEREAIDRQVAKLPPLEKELIHQKRLWEKAIERYTYQVNLKKHGFSEMEPSFFRTA